MPGMKFPTCWEVPTAHEDPLRQYRRDCRFLGPFPHRPSRYIHFLSDANSLVVPGRSTCSLTRNKACGMPDAFLNWMETVSGENMKSSAATSPGGRGDTRGSKGITLRRVWTDTLIGRIHARVGGEALDGPPVVLVHGMVISSRYMVPTALELAPLCPVYAVDLPGYGDSVKPHAILGLPELADALAAWMDAMRFRAAHLV